MPKNRGFYGFVEAVKNERRMKMARQTATIYRGKGANYTELEREAITQSYFDPMEINVRSIDFGGYKIYKSGGLYRFIHSIGTFILNNIDEFCKVQVLTGLSKEKLYADMEFVDVMGN